MKSISLVMMAYNEEGVIEQTIEDYYREITSKIPNSEFIIAEDGSTDNTRKILKRLKRKYRLTLLLGKERKGYAKAMYDALKSAKKPIVFFTDSDGQHDPKDFWRLVKHIKKYDIVSGQKKHRQDGLLRVWVSYFMNLFLSFVIGKRLKDANSGFKIMKKEVVDSLDKDFTMILASVEFMKNAVKNGFTVKEIPVSHFERVYGDSRGIPTSRIPKIIIDTLWGFIKK